MWAVSTWIWRSTIATFKIAGYATIQKLLLSRVATNKIPGSLSSFIEPSVSAGNPIKVQVDFLAGEYAGTGKAHRTQRVLEGRARKARGCDLAFDLFVETEIRGELPGGGADQAMVRVSVSHRLPGDERHGAA